MTSIDPRPPRSRPLMIWLIIATVIAVISIIPVAMMGMMSVMASDAGVNTTIVVFMWTMLTFPVAVALCPILAWIAFALRRERLALGVSLAPLLWLVAMVVLFSLGLDGPRTPI